MQNISFEFFSLLFDLVYIILVVKKENINVCVLPSFLSSGCWNKPKWKSEYPVTDGQLQYAEVNSGIRVQPFRDIKGSGRCTSSGHHEWVSITFYIILGTSQVFPIQYILFYCCFCSHTSKYPTSLVKSNIQIPSSTELLRPGVSRPVVS